MVSLTPAPHGQGQALACSGDDLFEGPEKTLTLCFKQRKVAAGSLRLIPQESWTEVLKHAKCEILSSVESTPLDTSTSAVRLTKGGKQKKVSTNGLTGYLLSESSLFLSDTTLSLKTCGRTTPLKALEPILDIVVPKWRQKCSDEYLSYTTFSRLGYMFPGEQLEPHNSWSEEVSYLERFFKGESTVLGTEVSSTFHLYVANYMPQGEIVDAFSMQVALTKLDPNASMAMFQEGGDSADAPLKSAWKRLHGDERRSVAANALVDERFFQPYGYSANGVFGRHFTTVHATPQPSCSYVSVETSMPMTQEARQRFVLGAEGLCCAGALTLTEFGLCPSLFCRPDVPQIPGFKLQRSSQSIGPTFACALHHFARETPLPWQPAALQAPGTVLQAQKQGAEAAAAAKARAAAAEAREAASKVPVIEVGEVSQGALKATQRFLAEDAGSASDLPMALLDVGAVKRRAEVWRRHLPRVEPFYAVKCNSHPALVSTLWQIWQDWGAGGFDCASPMEMATVAAAGVDLRERVVYANPCKQESAVVFAKSAGVRWVVFDNVAELAKLHRLYPGAELLLRLQTDDTLAQCPLSNKFGARVEDCSMLLAKAKELGLTVVGVSFHVGSGCSQRGAFRSALRRARAAFDEMERSGYEPRLLDIGGGFPGSEEEGEVGFAEHAADICELLEELFPSPSVRVIAEPGRFFAATAQALLATVVSVADAAEGCRYYLNDGVYGSFNCLIYDHAVAPQPKVIRNGEEMSLEESEGTLPCTVFGPTCDGFDVIAESMALPRLRVGDRLLFPDMGAYTSAASTSFNGFAPAAGWVYESKVA